MAKLAKATNTMIHWIIVFDSDWSNGQRGMLIIRT